MKPRVSGVDTSDWYLEVRQFLVISIREGAHRNHRYHYPDAPSGYESGKHEHSDIDRSSTEGRPDDESYGSDLDRVFPRQTISRPGIIDSTQC